MLLPSGGEFGRKRVGLPAEQVALGGEVGEGFSERGFVARRLVALPTEGGVLGGERLALRLPLAAFAGEFGLDALVLFLQTGELGGDGVVRGVRVGEFPGQGVLRVAECFALAVDFGESFAVLLPGGGEFGGKRAGLPAEKVALGGEVGEGFVQRIFACFELIVVAADVCDVRGQRLRLRFPVVALLGEAGLGRVVRLLHGSQLGGQRVVLGFRGGEFPGERVLRGGEA